MSMGQHDEPPAPRVLLVDDDEVTLLVTAAALRERGFVVEEALGGERALAWLAPERFDVIVLDALMPGLDGFAVCGHLRRTPGLEHVPVLMLTGLDDDASIERAYEVGATDFFVKSQQWSLLAGRLRYLLRAARTSLELIKSRTTLARAQDLARMGSFEWQRHERRLALSPEALRVLGHRARPGFSLRDLMRMVVAGQRRAMMGALRQVLRYSTVIDTDVTIALGEDRTRVLHIEAEPEFDEAGRVICYAGIVQDVTDRRQIEDKIKHLANFDSLTGLANRRQLIWRAELALVEAQRLGHRFALLLIDLDRFKEINDTLGHASGDELLVECSQRLRACLPQPDALAEWTLDPAMLRSHLALETVGRLGGDEFVALLPEITSEEQVQQVAQRMLAAMREPVLLGGAEYFITASIGASVYPQDGATVIDLLRHADVAMYTVKASGRNGLQLYRPGLSSKGREKLALESALHKAIERGELVFHYQPKVDLRTRKVVGVEALMRWRRAGQLVSPAEFIPLAEETGLIVPISEWALFEAARQAAAWDARSGLALPIAVNLPSVVFERSDLVETVRRAAATYGIECRMLELEITETGLMKDLQEVIPSLLRLNQLGVEISIDDFGTGYSSLAYLTTLPISEVKIDRSFIRDLGATEQSSAVVTAIIALARALGLRVIGEGVETMRQMAVLNRLGCHYMQGFLIARPMPGDDVEPWIQQTLTSGQAPWLQMVEASWAAAPRPVALSAQR